MDDLTNYFYQHRLEKIIDVIEPVITKEFIKGILELTKEVHDLKCRIRKLEEEKN